MKFIIPILEDKDLKSDRKKGLCLGSEFKECRENLEDVVRELPLPISVTEANADHQLLQGLTNQLFDVLYLSFTLLDRLEDFNRGTIKNGEKDLIKNIQYDNWRLKKIIEVEI